MELKGKVAIVTGSTRGMGKAIAELFSKEGAAVIVHGRDMHAGEGLARELRQHSPAYFVAGDLTERETSEKLVHAAVSEFGRLDIVVANAGTLGLGTVTAMDETVWHQAIGVNLNAIFWICRFGIPAMQSGGAGCIVVNSSIAAFKSFPNHPAYCASKAAAVALTRQVALEYGPAIRANVMCPGPVDTPLIHASAIAFPDPQKAVADAGQKTVLKRLGMPGDVANLALFLASDKSAWMSGSVVTIDGGVTVH
ncbi:MAG TPA: SDR family oxidoreductase [Chryseosolibacter sp.]|nr:SDR family oxidoreductase [Chryseosolibacter sp.]